MYPEYYCSFFSVAVLAIPLCHHIIQVVRLETQYNLRRTIWFLLRREFAYALKEITFMEGIMKILSWVLQNIQLDYGGIVNRRVLIYVSGFNVLVELK